MTTAQTSRTTAVDQYRLVFFNAQGRVAVGCRVFDSLTDAVAAGPWYARSFPMGVRWAVRNLADEDETGKALTALRRRR